MAHMTEESDEKLLLTLLHLLRSSIDCLDSHDVGFARLAINVLKICGSLIVLNYYSSTRFKVTRMD